MTTPNLVLHLGITIVMKPGSAGRSMIWDLDKVSNHKYLSLQLAW